MSNISNMLYNTIMMDIQTQAILLHMKGDFTAAALLRDIVDDEKRESDAAVAIKRKADNLMLVDEDF